MDTLLGALHAAGWATYVGGSITMDWILRHAQRTMPPSQVAVVCKQAGMRYRWVALGALAVIGFTGAIMLTRVDTVPLGNGSASRELSISSAYGRTLAGLTVLWVVLAATVALMAFWLHPAQRKRSSPEMTEAEVAAERQRVGQAITRMDHALRFELVVSIVAVGLGASLQTGGLF